MKLLHGILLPRETAKPKATFGEIPDETMTLPADRRYHSSHFGWIDNSDESNREVLAAAPPASQPTKSRKK